MKPKSERTINSIAKMSPVTVTTCTLIFALSGSALAKFNGFWGIWIPFCFWTLPVLHYLSRELVQTKERLAELEAEIQTIKTVGKDMPTER